MGATVLTTHLPLAGSHVNITTTVTALALCAEKELIVNLCVELILIQYYTDVLGCPCCIIL